MKERFFKPFKGAEYDKGICGKKVLVLGASFYCPKTDCEFWNECTNPEKKDSSKFDEICPYYAKLEGHPKLSDEPTNAISDCIKTYKVFAKYIYQFFDDKDVIGQYDYDKVWNRLAFTDYVQFFLPTIKTHRSYFSKRDFNAFIEVLQKLKPDVVIAWGLPITTEIRDNSENNSIFTDLDKLPETEYYICHMRVVGIDHEITYVSCYHPSSVAYWYNNLETLTHYLKGVL